MAVVPITSTTGTTAEPLAQADVACYTAKDLGRNRVYVYQTADPVVARRHTEMLCVADLKGALQENRLQLYYQPIVALSPPSDACLRYEFLLRLVDAQGETVLPKSFIMAAEHYGLMGTIDRWVIRKALHYAAEGNSLGVGIAVNLSGNSLNDEGLLAADRIEDAFREAGDPDSFRMFTRGYRRYRSDSDGPRRRYRGDAVRERLYYVRRI